MKLIESGSKDIYNVLFFKINIVLLNFIFTKNPKNSLFPQTYEAVIFL